MDLFQEVEWKADDDGRPSDTHTGAMIALRPRQDHIDRLAVVDGEPPEELHTTILFLGKAADYTYDTRARIIYAMREIAQRFRFVTGKGFGINIWNPDGEEPCIVLGVGGSELVDIRNAIVEKLQGFDLLQVPEQHEPWQPHITLNYTDDHSKALEYLDLAGEVVYDAIRIAFGGIVDDIPLQATESGNDGYAGGNRYAAVPLTVVKSFRPIIRVNEVLTKAVRQDPNVCKFCGAKATRLVIGDNEKKLYTCVEHTDDADEWFDANTDVDSTRVIGKSFTPRVPIRAGFVLDEKVIRRVRTAAGVRRYGQPIGSVIVSDGKLSNLKTVNSEYDGYDKYTRGGKPIYVHKNGGKYEAVDANDNVIATHANQESLLKELDSGGGKKAGRTSEQPAATPRSRGSKYEMPAPTVATSRVPLGYREYVTSEESEYDGYHKYRGKDGKVFYAADDWSALYDENDNVLARSKVKNPSERRDLLFRGMRALVSDDKQSPAPKKKPAAKTSRSTSTDAQLKAAPVALSKLRDDDEASYAALTRYSNMNYEQVNAALRSGKNLRKHQSEVDAIDAAIKRSPLKRDVQVYRGITNADKLFGNDGTGKTVVDKAFLSTSSDRERAARFTELSGYDKEVPALVTIRAPKGTRAIYMDETNEAELLFERGMRLRVVSDTGARTGRDRQVVMEVVK